MSRQRKSSSQLHFAEWPGKACARTRVSRLPWGSSCGMLAILRQVLESATICRAETLQSCGWLRHGVLCVPCAIIVCKSCLSDYVPGLIVTETLQCFHDNRAEWRSVIQRMIHCPCIYNQSSTWWILYENQPLGLSPSSDMLSPSRFFLNSSRILFTPSTSPTAALPLSQSTTMGHFNACKFCEAR